ncbi:MAG TPA: hypothetical protein VFV87_06975 [Pirellulaceae bacterium]|nr:hypothetical protein [Pirellulaceae bacterium]
MRIRKPVSQVSLEDLRKHPVWEFASDEEGNAGQDETTVRPVKFVSPLELARGSFIVRSEFELRDGTKMLGYATPQAEDDSLAVLQPVIVTERGQVFFWHGVLAPGAKEIKESYKLLGRTAKETFPIELAIDVELSCTPPRATIPGFMVLVDWKTGETRVLK